MLGAVVHWHCTPLLNGLEFISHEFKPMTYSGIFLHEKAQPGTPLLDEDLFGKVVTCPEIAHAADWTLSLKQPNQFQSSTIVNN